MRGGRLVFFAFVLLAAVSLAFWPSAASARSVRDAVGRLVEVPQTPRRIVSLVPSVTEILYAVGAEKTLAGITEFSDYPPRAARLPSVGRYDRPSLEAIVALKPDLVFATADCHSREFVGALEKLGLAVYVVYARSISATLNDIRILAELACRAREGQALADSMEREFAAVRTRSAGCQRPKVVLCIMLRPLMVCTPRTLGGELLAAAGADNLVPDGGASYPVWSREALLAADPDIIIAVSHAQDEDPAAFFRVHAPALAGRVRVIPADWLCRPGPRLLLGLRALEQALDAWASRRDETRDMGHDRNRGKMEYGVLLRR